MRFGLEENIIEKIIQVFEENSKVDKALIFGSRAKGNWRPDSDIDIAVKGFYISMDDILKMSVAIESNGIVNKIDLIDYKSIKEPALKEHIDRMGIEFYTNWKEYKIADIISLEYGKGLLNYHNGTGKYDVYGTNGKIGTTDNFLYDKPSVIIGRKGAYREVYLSKKPFFVIDTAFYTKNKFTNLDTIFLYYWFKNIDINEMDSGSAIPSTSRDEVYDVGIKLPPQTEQFAISSILSSLDDKIDLLHHQNKTLEQLAETLFRQWFVEKTTNTKPLGILSKVTTGKGLKRNEFIEKGDYPVLGANGEMGRTNNFLTEERLILTGRVGTLGQISITDNKVWISDNVLIIKPFEERFFYPIYFSLKRVDFETLNAGSTQPLVTQTDLKRVEINSATDSVLKEFLEQCKNYFQKIKSNTNQIRTLNQLRDTLLPKLMSGEVRVNF